MLNKYNNFKYQLKKQNMKKMILIAALPILFWTSCTKESETGITSNLEIRSNGKKITRPIAVDLQSDPNSTGASTYGTMTHLGKVHGTVVLTSFDPISDGVFSFTTDDITYAANGDELWTKGTYTLNYPTDGSTIATISGGGMIVGGTGRFAGATGFIVYENMVQDLATGHESHTGHGEIKY